MPLTALTVAAQDWTPDPHQIEGARFLNARGRALLADEPGVGKSLQVIMACDTDARIGVGGMDVLVAGPAVSTENWAAEWERFQTVNRPVRILHRGVQPGAGVNIVSYDRLVADEKLRKAAKARRWHVLVLDEAHFLRRKQARRTKVIYGQHAHGDGLAACAERVWLLTGTPTPNFVHELYTHVRALWPEIITTLGQPMSEHDFIKAFCKVEHSPFGMKVRGHNENVKHLRAAMTPWTLRRLKRDVFPDMPPVRYVTTPLALDPRKIDWSLIPEAVGQPPADEQALLGWLDRNFAHLSQLREVLGRAKAGAGAEYVKTLLEGGEAKVVVFAHHKAVIAQLQRDLADYGVLTIDGSVSQPRRFALASEFNTRQEARVLVGQITAAGTAITLSAASAAVVVEASWVPDENVQAVARLHRRGQTETVLARFLTVPRSLDDQITNALVRKARATAQLWAK